MEHVVFDANFQCNYASINSIKVIYLYQIELAAVPAVPCVVGLYSRLCFDLRFMLLLLFRIKMKTAAFNVFVLSSLICFMFVFLMRVYCF